jgi:hypothetical protein
MALSIFPYKKLHSTLTKTDKSHQATPHRKQKEKQKMMRIYTCIGKTYVSSPPINVSFLTHNSAILTKTQADKRRRGCPQNRKTAIDPELYEYVFGFRWS